MKLRNGVTLGELLMVVIILSILVTIALAQYQRTVRIARVREAQASLRLIQAGQKIYRDENGSYYGDTSDISLINDNLGLDLEEDYWDYQVFDPGASGTVGRADASTGTGLHIDDSGDACCDSAPCYHVAGCL